MFEVSTAGKLATAAAVLSQRDRVTSLRGEEVGPVCLSVADCRETLHLFCVVMHIECDVAIVGNSLWYKKFVPKQQSRHAMQYFLQFTIRNINIPFHALSFMLEWVFATSVQSR